MYKVLLLGASSLLPFLKDQLLCLSVLSASVLPAAKSPSLGELSLGSRRAPRERAQGTDLPKRSAVGRANPKTFIVNFKMESGYEQTQKTRETSQTQK